MNDKLESAKEYVNEHPTEVACAVGAVGVLATIFYFKKKEKRTAKTCSCNHTPQIGWFSRWLDYRKTRLELQLAAIK